MNTSVSTEGLKDLLEVGRITGIFGVKGWVRIYSYTEPRENILSFQPWLVGKDGNWHSMRLAEGQRHSKGIIARLEHIKDRNAAASLMGSEIAIHRTQLPDIEPGEYYWTELEGLQVNTKDGVELGVVDHLIETGANDVLVVKGKKEHLIPYIPNEVILEIDLEQGSIRVDWDSDI